MQLADNSNQHLRNIGLDALDQSICAVLGSDGFQDNAPTGTHGISQEVRVFALLSLKLGIISLITEEKGKGGD